MLPFGRPLGRFGVGGPVGSWREQIRYYDLTTTKAELDNKVLTVARKLSQAAMDDELNALQGHFLMFIMTHCVI